jgi:(p)ppGpp synthase/HD superfamily hydrolase
MQTIEFAEEFVTRAFSHIRRKHNDEPYVNHLIRVKNILSEYPFYTEEMGTVALLHDVLEDLSFVNYYALCHLFGEQIASYVLELTNVYTSASFPDLNRQKRKELELQRIKGIKKLPKLVKLADIINNTEKLWEESTTAKDKSFARIYFREKFNILTYAKMDVDLDLFNRSLNIVSRGVKISIDK